MAQNMPLASLTEGERRRGAQVVDALINPLFSAGGRDLVISACYRRHPARRSVESLST